jgi:hypothetical protein
MNVKSHISLLAGVGIETIEQSVSPRGDVLYGLRCPPGETWEMWRGLREAAGKTGLQAFVSHQSPGEWEWDRSRQPDGGDRPSPDHGATLARLVAARSSQLGESEGLANRLTSLDPRPRGRTAEEFFARPPEWVCLAEVREPSRLPTVLDAPSTPNWTGGPSHPVLRYADHVDVLRSWHSRFDASVCYLASNALMVQVGRPPRTAADVAAVAVEQYAYCPDLDQVIGTLDDVAREQACADQWFFWWD